MSATEETTKITAPPGSDLAIDVASFVTSAVPWFGGPVSNVLSGISVNRKMTRLQNFIEGVVADIKAHDAEKSKTYVKTEEFEELLERTLKQVTNERSDEKRHLYRAFLSDSIKSPECSYDDRIRCLRVLEELQMDHVKLLKVLLYNSQSTTRGQTGIQLPSLKSRLSEMASDRVLDLSLHLNNLGLTQILSEGGMLSLTPFGRRFVRFIRQD